MAGNYRTPGVYVEEISKLPPSIAQVETAVPAFIGYTEKAEKDGKNLIAPGATPTPVRITSMLDYEVHFGGAPLPDEVVVNLNANKEVQRVEISPKWFLYYSLQMFFGNGGGKCYVVSVGDFGAGSVDKDKLKAGLAAIYKVDEPTLLVIPDAALLDDDAYFAEVQVEMLKQCAALQDRFAILDIKHAKQEDYDPAEVDTFRNNIGINHLNYGASYFPWLKSTLSVAYSYGKLKLTQGQSATPVNLFDISAQSALATTLDNLTSDSNEKVGLNFTAYQGVAKTNNRAELADRVNAMISLTDAFLALTFTDVNVAADFTDVKNPSGSPLNDLISILRSYELEYEDDNGALRLLSSDPVLYTNYSTTAPTGLYNSMGSETETTVVNTVRPFFDDLFSRFVQLIDDFFAGVALKAVTIEEELLKKDPLYSSIVKAIRGQGIVLPPSGAIAGIYAYVDSSRGVWKAPANVSLSMVKGPTVNITHADQEELNVDPNAGKSVNAIRAFTGKGTLVWGARTLAGNDNEWRYVPVRRLFIMVEESVMKGSEPFVFEPNDRNTWMKVKAMIQNYLTGLWQQGALAGAKPEDAFFVSVGLGETMTAQDILEGRLIIEIGMAAVRPAEFIILRFSHKMQES